MKINSRQSTLLNKCPVKTEIKKNKEPSDKVVIGDFKPDDSLFMGDKLKNLKFSSEESGNTKRAVIEATMVAAGAGLFGMVGYEAGAAVGGPLTTLALTATAAFIGANTAQGIADRVL